MTERVIVLSNQNIFSEGVVSRLRQHALVDEVHFFDSEDDNSIQKVFELAPSVIIVDSSAEGDPKCSLVSELLNFFPSITILRLRLQEKDVQVITSSPKTVMNVQDLIDLVWREES